MAKWRVYFHPQRGFVFSAEEQKHWYETLRFVTDSTAVRCPSCRRGRRRIENARRAWAARLGAGPAAALRNAIRATR